MIGKTPHRPRRRVLRAAGADRKLPTRGAPASPATTDPSKSRPAKTSPSSAGRLFNRCEVLDRGVDVRGSARGLRVGGLERRAREQQHDREGKLVHGFSPCSPNVARPSPRWLRNGESSAHEVCGGPLADAHPIADIDAAHVFSFLSALGGRRCGLWSSDR